MANQIPETFVYRNYFKTTLSTTELKIRNKAAPDNIRYCNGTCQDYISQEEFSGQKMICRNCMNKINLANSLILRNKITLEQFRNNPNIVYSEEKIDTEVAKLCKKCKENKPLSAFEEKRRICKACRAIQKSARNSDIDGYIRDIEKLKINILQLEKYILHIPKDKLVLIISHYSIGRKSSDTKDVMVKNTVDHFRKLLNPMLCQGGCGYELKEQFSMCNDCKEKQQGGKK